MSKILMYIRNDLVNIDIDNADIGNDWVSKYSGNETIKNVTFTSITNVDDFAMWNAFADCPNLMTANFPALVTVKTNSLGYCFSGSAVQQVSFPVLVNIEDSGLAYAFDNCKKLTTITFPKLETIAYGGLYRAFRKTRIRTISFPQLTTIGQHGLSEAFKGSKVISVSFPKLTSIDSNGLKSIFADCDKLQEVHFPVGLKDNDQCIQSNLGCLDSVRICFDL